MHHEGRERSEERRFWGWMALFMGSMVGLACARDLILLLVFFDLTAVASYFLIGFDRDTQLGPMCNDPSGNALVLAVA